LDSASLKLFKDLPDMLKCWYMKHLNAKITGSVQGVFFRAEAKKKAKQLGLAGFIRNEADGSVYIEVEGEESLIADLMKWCQDGGPELASVEHVNHEYEEGLKNFEDFSIRA